MKSSVTTRSSRPALGSRRCGRRRARPRRRSPPTRAMIGAVEHHPDERVARGVDPRRREVAAQTLPVRGERLDRRPCRPRPRPRTRCRCRSSAPAAGCPASRKSRVMRALPIDMNVLAGLKRLELGLVGGVHVAEIVVAHPEPDAVGGRDEPGAEEEVGWKRVVVHLVRRARRPSGSPAARRLRARRRRRWRARPQRAELGERARRDRRSPRRR